MRPAATGPPVSEKEHTHKVLVVEDEDTARDSLLMLLRAEGFEADGVGNGKEALRVLRQGYEACLILLDLAMPVMNGWAFRVEQRRDAQLADIPVAVLTATADAAQEGERLGAVAGLQKPLDATALLDLVADHCPRTGTRRSYWRP
jgi:CheY-like chemotaxis protein